MTEGSTGSSAKPRIQSLSDLIFGLALSIGALTLIGQKPSDFQGLVLSILYYGFSFLILINIWRSYTHTMSLLPVETAKLINLNILLLFLVSIEPYLFNQLLASSLVMAQNVSILYAFDLGGLVTIQTFFTNSLISEKKKSIPEQLLREYKLRRNLQLIIAVIFFASAIPVFWTWRIELSNIANTPLRLIFWFIALFLSVLGYRWILPKTEKRVISLT
jgi:uncharacterized membrane protein